MKIKKDASCPACVDRLGHPVDVVDYREENYTEYVCGVCGEEWLREH